MDEHLNLVVLGSCVLLLVAVLAVRVASRTKLPVLLIYLALGMAVGEAGLGIRFSDYQLGADLGLFALAVILAEGGLTTRWSEVRPVLPFAVVLSTVGVVVSVAVIATAAHLLLGIDTRTAILLGGVVSSTDAAAVFSVLRRLPLKGRVRSVLEAESGLNDAPVVVLVTLASSAAWGETAPLAIVGLAAYELAAGAALGVLIGFAGRFLLARAALPSAGLYPVATVGLTLLAFTATNALHASGFLAVYLAGMVLGSARLPHRRAVLGFAGSLALLAEAGLFLMLGLLSSPSRLPEALPTALLVGAVATLLARPLAVSLSALPFRLPWREQAFVSWAGLRGAVPIVLAIIPVTQGIPEGTRILDVVLVLVVVYTLLQAPTLPLLGRRLGLVEAVHATDLEVEAAPLEEAHADVLGMSVPPRSHLIGVYVDELRLPPGAHLTLVVRGPRSLVPDRYTRLEAGDQLLVVSTPEVRAAAEARLRAVSRGGKLADWLH
ncbi:MAG: sodium/hydrogen exchanger [Frankiales bacterium]|jgi:cell volume regulation protein A|nr:sodium/hydrogen exchanger [Frankiales bacterium]